MENVLYIVLIILIGLSDKACFFIGCVMFIVNVFLVITTFYWLNIIAVLWMLASFIYNFKWDKPVSTFLYIDENTAI